MEKRTKVQQQTKIEYNKKQDEIDENNTEAKREAGRNQEEKQLEDHNEATTSETEAMPQQGKQDQVNLDTHLLLWGYHSPEINTCETLHLIYQNAGCAMKPSRRNPSTVQMVESLQNLNCSIFCASETNINWKKLST